MPGELRRRTPEELLSEAQVEERQSGKGYLKIFLGYASGVGKSFRMLDEARRRHERGQDVVVGGIQRKMPAEVEALLGRLEVIPLKTVAGGAAIDVEAIVRRRPSVCFIDGLAYSNPPGTRNAARWQDIQDLLSAGVNVIGSANIQYIAELGEQVEAITGKHVEETIPMTFVKSADEIEIVDAPPEEPGDRQQKLSRLRELALIVAADVVDQQLTEYLEERGITQRPATRERILVCITPRANVREMMETARIIAGRFHADLIAAYVKQDNISHADQTVLDEKLSLARDAGATIEILSGEDPVSAILNFARARGITQLFIGHSQRSGIGPLLWGNPVERLIGRSRGMDVRVFPQ